MTWIVEFLDEDVQAVLGSHAGRHAGSVPVDGIARAAYVTAICRRVVVVHVFAKKTQKTSRREIETALRRAKEVE